MSIILGPWEMHREPVESNKKYHPNIHRYIFGTNVIFAHIWKLRRLNKFGITTEDVSGKRENFYNSRYEFDILFDTEEEAKQYLDDYLVSKGCILLDEKKAKKLLALV
jgi:hypothetical protein